MWVLPGWPIHSVTTSGPRLHDPLGDEPFDLGLDVGKLPPIEHLEGGQVR